MFVYFYNWKLNIVLDVYTLRDEFSQKNEKNENDYYKEKGKSIY